ncbi:MAG TPA: F0F1 ATP synthase subunit A [Thermomicrobiales bacterium]|nr:F0F1 ATP synthase subunit A [Thermomicrobiales bacterium]
MDIHISLPAEVVAMIGPLHLTNSAIMMLLVMIGLVVWFGLAMRRQALVPGGAQNLVEWILEWILGQVEGAAGKRVGRTIFPLVATLFVFIIVANYTGLLPFVGTVGYTNHEGEFIPFLRSANADLNMTLAMALLSVFLVQVAGLTANGLGGYLKHLLTPIPLAPIHIIEELARIISLSFRLFGNIFGGEVLMTVIYALTYAVIPVIFIFLELLFGFIQAMIFSMLTMSYIILAVAGHEEHEEEEQGGIAAIAAQETGAHM